MRSAASIVALVSFASSGETSIDTQPSMPWVRSNSGLKQIGGAAQVLQSQFDEQLFAGQVLPPAFWRMLLSYAAVLPMASSNIVGLDVRPGHRELLDIAAQRAVVENFAGDVVEPQTLAQIVQVFRACSWLHLKVG